MTACIKSGSPWNVIQAWQEFTQSQDCGPKRADGKWGAETEAAIGQFQREHNIHEVSPTGRFIVGPLTYAAAVKLGFVVPAVIVPPGNVNVVIDISHYQKQVDLPKVKEGGILAVIHKCTQGITMVDDRYAERQPIAEKAGLLWGAYHFGENAPGREQAQFFLRNVNLDGKTVCVLDWEKYTVKVKDKDGKTKVIDKTMTAEQAKDFIQEFHRHTGMYPGLYGGISLKQFMGEHPDPIFQKCWLWFSSYTRKIKEIPQPWTAYTLWQYTSAVHAQGVEGCCDHNFYTGDVASLRNFWDEEQA